MDANENDAPDAAPPGPTLQDRRFAALRGCERVLSGARPQTLRERLAALQAEAGPAYDLDQRPDFYGGSVLQALEVRVAGLLGTEDAAFFPTGTMAQQVAMRIWSERRGERNIALHPLHHPEMYERRAYAALGGLRSVWPTTEPRIPTPQELRDFDEPYAVLALELPLREAGFLLPSWEELTATVAAARTPVHFDGARLWESVFHLGRPLPEIAGLADSVYVSFYKTLGGINGAALAGDHEFVKVAKAWRHRYGGQLFQQWPAALSALAGLDRELPLLESYVDHAKVVAGALAGALAGLPGARVHPEPPHTHQFQLWLPYPAQALDEAGVRLAEESGLGLFGGWRDSALPGLATTEVTVASPALEWTAKDVAAAVDAFLALL